MTHGERRVAQRLESHLGEDSLTRATCSLLVTCYKENSISRQLTKFAGVDLQEQQDDYA